VVTWLTNQNCHIGVLGKLPTLALLAARALEEPQADSSAEAAAVALTSPVPASSLRRVGLSRILSASMASSTLGFTFAINDLQIGSSGRKARKGFVRNWGKFVKETCPRPVAVTCDALTSGTQP
jgi:hypothetical protein